MSPLQSIQLREIRLPLREPFVASHGTVTDRRVVLLELRDGDGHQTWSECVALADPSYTPETADTCWLAIREWLAPRLLGRRFESPREVHAALTKGVRGHAMARAALEMGCWGLEAIRRGLSLAALLGGSRAEVATGVALGMYPDLGALAAKVADAVAEGYSRIKLKIQPGADVEPLRVACRIAGSRVAVIADANSAYTLSDIAALQQLDDLGLQMIEQPLAWDDLVRHSELQRQLKTPVCLDESIDSLARAEDMLNLKSGRIINLKPGRVGGFTEALAIHTLCRSRGVPLWCGGMLETGIGRAYNIALASLPGFTLPGDLSPSARYWQQDIVEPEWTMNPEGLVAVPTTPGLGVDVNHDRIEDLTVRQKLLTADCG